MSDSPVQPVALGDALKVSLDNYYDLLKTQVGGLGAAEYLQLKLVADPVDISDEKYRYWSQYNLLNRSDLGIEPTPVAGTVLTSPDQLNAVYGRFLKQLRQYVTARELDANEQRQLADIDVSIDRVKDKTRQTVLREVQNWRQYCEATGRDLGDRGAYLQWTIFAGEGRTIEDLNRQLQQLLFDRKTITDRTYPDPEDREIVDAEFDYESPQMRLRYPINPDYYYSDQSRFSLEYLATLPLGSSALFDDRRALSWNLALQTMQTSAAGAFDASWDRTTGESSSIRTDWNYSGSAGWSVISVRADVSETRKISEDFKKATGIRVAAKAAYKVQIAYPGWFKSQLFTHKHVRENPRDFDEFFGDRGSLLYYPTHLVLVRGFSAAFTSSQSWTYDYDRNFSASAGGGFSVFGIKFGSSGSYGSHITEHKFDKTATTLTVADDDKTLRFVGYVVKKNTLFENVSKELRFDRRFSPVSEPREAPQVRLTSLMR